MSTLIFKIIFFGFKRIEIKYSDTYKHVEGAVAILEKNMFSYTKKINI
jgi:hypothetical protein